MQRDRNYDIAIGGRVGEFLAEEFRERLCQRLIESIFVPPDERRQRAAIALGRRTIARDGTGAGEVGPPIEARCAAIFEGAGGLHRRAANRADRLGNFLDSGQARIAHAAYGFEAEAIPAHRTSRRIKKIRNLPERRIHAQ